MRPGHKLAMIVVSVVSLAIIVTACGQNSDSQSPMAPQPTVYAPIYTPTMIVEFLMPGDVLGVVVDENNRVLEVEPDSAADRAGVKVSDELDSLDGIPFKDKDKVKNRIRERQEGMISRLKLKRGEQKEILELDIHPAPSLPSAEFTPTPVFPPNDYF